MFDWTIWLGIIFGVIGLAIAFLYTLIEIYKEGKA